MIRDYMVGVSDWGIGHILAEEGKRNEMYKDQAGLPTIGVGHLLTKDELSSGKIHFPTTGPAKWRKGLTDKQVTALLKKDIRWVESTLNTDPGVNVSLTQRQYDILASFIFNVGARAFAKSTLLKRLNRGEYEAIGREMKKWKYSRGKVLPVLVRRRKREAKLWAATL